MRGVGSAVRPIAGVARRAALVSDATTAGERAFGMKQQRGVAPAPRCVMERESSSTRRAGPEAFSVPRSTGVDVKKRAASVSRRAAPVHDAAAGERASRKRQPAAPCEMARDSPARRPGVEFLDSKRVKVTHNAAVKMPVDTGPERLKKRLAAELDALHELVKMAEALSRGNGRFLAAELRLEKTPAAKRIKTSPIVEQIDAPRMLPAESKIKSVPEEEIDICGGVVCPVAIRGASPRIPVEEASQTCSSPSSTSRGMMSSEKRRKTPPLVEQIDALRMSPEEGEIVILPEEDEEYIDICGGVSPIAIRYASPLVSIEKADEFKINIVPAEQGEYVDICGGVDATPLVPMELTREACSPMSSSSDSGSSSSSDSDSGSDSDASNSDSDSESESATVAGIHDAQSTEPEKKLEGNVPISVLLARAKEAHEIRQQKGNGWEREKTRRAVRQMEKAVPPDESIHPRELEQIGIMEFDYVLEDLGVFLRPDV